MAISIGGLLLIGAIVAAVVVVAVLAMGGSKRDRD
jgi:hypothetical protein